ncbi:dynamin family protein [Helicobacter sp. T3_23-1056]
MNKRDLPTINNENLLESFIQECLNLGTNNPLQKEINATRYALNQSQLLAGFPNDFADKNNASTQNRVQDFSNNFSNNFAHDFTRDFSQSAQEMILQRLEKSTQKEQLSHLKIAIIGQFSSGKSSFLNALLGAEILPSGVIPVTAKVCEIAYGEHSDFSQNLAQISSQTITQTTAQNPQNPPQKQTQNLQDSQNPSQNLRQNLAQNPPQNLLQNIFQNILIEVHYKDFSIGLKPLSYLHQIDSIENATISHFRLLAPLDLLKNITFLDTPGFNSQNQIDTDTTNAILEEVDGIIWLSLIDNVGKQSEKDILESHLKKYSAKSLCILNQKDRLKNDNEIATSLAYANSAFSGFFARIIPISAKEAIDSHNAKNAKEKQRLWASSNMQSVLDFIHEELQEKTTAIKTKKVLRSLESLLIKEAFRVHRATQARISLNQHLQTKAALMRFCANQSDLQARFDTLFPQLNAKLDSLAQYIFNSQVLKQIPYQTTHKNALGLSKRILGQKSVMMLEKDTLKSELTKSENPFFRDFIKIGFMINDFGKYFREFVRAQQSEFESMLEAWLHKISAYENIHIKQDFATQDFGKLVFAKRDFEKQDFLSAQDKKEAFEKGQKNSKANEIDFAKMSLSSFIDSISKEYLLLQEEVCQNLQTELSNLKNILTLQYQNTIELTLESLDNKMTYALKKHLENPSDFEPFSLSLENVRECLNQGLHFLLFQDKLLLINALYKTSIFSLSEKINDFYEAKYPTLLSQINALQQSKKRLLDERHRLKNYPHKDFLHKD